MEENETPNPPRKKTGNKPKQLKEATYLGIEVGRGETKKIINPRDVEKLAAIGMKNSEIAEWFGIDDSTLSYNFKQEITKGKLNLIQSLRRAQISVALGGNPTLLIWLGRNLLGQSDSPINNEALAPLPWSDME
jgi:hypothetical protein